MSDEYAPPTSTVRYRYVAGDYSCGIRDPHAEFDRFIARIKAEAWDEGAEAFQAAAIHPKSTLLNPYRAEVGP